MKFRVVPAVIAACLLAAAWIWMGGRGARGSHAPVLSRSRVDAVAGATAAPVKKSMMIRKSSVPAPTAADIAKLETLDSVLEGKNDNDPRLDTDFNHLTEAQKELFRQKYRSIASEKRNEKGTVVFLLGRNITSPKDVDFLASVLSEAPCRSLSNCSEDAGQAAPGTDSDPITGMTLVYPQMVALYSMENVLDQAKAGSPVSPATINEIRKTIDSACKSPIPRIADKAMSLRDRLEAQG